MVSCGTAAKQKEKSGVTGGRSQSPWSMEEEPPYGYVELNVDGSFCAASGTGGTGVVIRES